MNFPSPSTPALTPALKIGARSAGVFRVPGLRAGVGATARSRCYTARSAITTDVYGASVEVTCAYWRKANQIHRWFVDNVQGGNDNCGEYYVSQEQLQELLDLVKRTLAERNPTLLSPLGGFFFGGTDIDEWYWLGLKNTQEQLERVLNLPQVSDLSFTYSSSW